MGRVYFMAQKSPTLYKVGIMEEKLNAILETVRQVQKKQADLENHLNDIDEGLAKDRNGIQDLNIKVGQNVAEVAELRGSVNLLSEKVKNKVTDAIQPLQDQADKISGQIKNSKTVVFGIDNRPWWKRLIGEFRKEVAN